MGPGATLPFFLQAVGRGAQGFTEGQDQADRHREAIQAIRLRDQAGWQNQLMFPTQLRAAQLGLRGLEPMTPDVRSGFNALGPELNAPQLGEDVTEHEGMDIYGLAQRLKAAQAMAGFHMAQQNDDFFKQALLDYHNKIAPWQAAIKNAQAQLGDARKIYPDKVRNQLNYTIQSNQQRINDEKDRMKHTFQVYGRYRGFDPGDVDSMLGPDDEENQQFDDGSPRP